MAEELSAPSLSDVNWYSGRFSKICNWLRNILVDVDKYTVYSFAFVFLFWSFASLLLLAGDSEPKGVRIGPNSSVLVEPNSCWVQSIKVKEFDHANSGLELFGFYESPPLNVNVNWSESRLLSLSTHSSKGWPYYLNKGASLNISYTVKPEGSSALLVVDKGQQHFNQSSSLEEPKYEETALSMNLIQGSNVIELNISEASSYYVTVSNLNMKDVKVEFDIDMKALLYNTKRPFYKCTFNKGICKISALSLFKHPFVLNSPELRQGASLQGCHIKFSCQPRWIGYIIGTGLVICFGLVCIQLPRMWVTYLFIYDSKSSQRKRLLANYIDDDGPSMGSYYQFGRINR